MSVAAPRVIGLLVLAMLCQAVATARASGLVPLGAGTGPDAPAPWHAANLPMQKMPHTRFSVVELDGQRVLRLEADRSYGNLVHPLAQGEAGRILSWRWRVDMPNERVNLRVRGGDDSAAKVCVMFDLPFESVPFLDRQVLRVARLRSTEQLPTATLCYVWDPQLPTGTVLDNAYTRRVRLIVLRGQGTPPATWSQERRDVHADFLKLFGDEAQTVPALVGIGLSADADNTQGRSLSHVADLRLEP